jgi:hypothetical protein
MLAVYAVEGRPEEIPALLEKKYAGLLTRVAFYMPYQGATDAARLRRVVQAFPRA